MINDSGNNDQWFPWQRIRFVKMIACNDIVIFMLADNTTELTGQDLTPYSIPHNAIYLFWPWLHLVQTRFLYTMLTGPKKTLSTRYIRTARIWLVYYAYYLFMIWKLRLWGSNECCAEMTHHSSMECVCVNHKYMTTKYKYIASLYTPRYSEFSYYFQ